MSSDRERLRNLIWGRDQNDPHCLVNTITKLCEENERLQHENDQLRQQVKSGPRCATCRGNGVVLAPGGDSYSPCEACDGKGF